MIYEVVFCHLPGRRKPTEFEESTILAEGNYFTGEDPLSYIQKFPKGSTFEITIPGYELSSTKSKS
jgi:hypothetical protein